MEMELKSDPPRGSRGSPRVTPVQEPRSKQPNRAGAGTVLGRKSREHNSGKTEAMAEAPY